MLSSNRGCAPTQDTASSAGAGLPATAHSSVAVAGPSTDGAAVMSTSRVSPTASSSS